MHSQEPVLRVHRLETELKNKQSLVCLLNGIITYQQTPTGQNNIRCVIINIYLLKLTNKYGYFNITKKELHTK